MSAEVKPIPDGYNTVSVYLFVPDAVEAIVFYGRAFGAETLFRMPGPNGEGTMHAEVRIGDSIVMMADENPQWKLAAPKTLGGATASLHLYVDDVDSRFRQALEAGCTEVMPVQDMFWGDRFGKLADPYGHHWGIASRKEILTAEQVAKRAKEAMAAMEQGNGSGNA